MKKVLICSALLGGVCCFGQKGNTGISKGNDYYHTGQYDLAEKYYRAALKKEPANATAAYNLANALYSQKRYQEAIGVLQSIKVDAKNTSLLAAIQYNTGVNHTKERDLEASIESYKAALRLTPDDKEARENLQKALLELKREQQQRQQQQQQRSSMSQSEAQQRLQQLQEKEKQIQERMSRNRSREGNGMEKDW